MNVANGSGAVVRADLNAHLEAATTLNSGATAPTTTFANMWWADTSANILKRRNNANTAWISVMDLTSGLIIGTNVQAYDADTAKTDVAQSFTAPQRADMATVTDGTLDLNDAQNFIYTPGGADTLEFSNEAAGQSGIIFLTNGSNYAITLGTEIMAPDGTATAISTTGEYVLTYAVEAAGGGADTVKLTYATVV